MTEEQAFYKWSADERGNISVQDAWLERASRDRGVELAKLILAGVKIGEFKNAIKLAEQILRDAE